MNIHIKTWIGILVIIIIAITAGIFIWKVYKIDTVYAPTPQTIQAPKPEVKEDNIGMANPASVFCEDNGGTLEIVTAPDGSQSGICKFSDGSQCEEWAFQRDECKIGDSQKEVDTSDWQTYRNEEYGFEFKYPKNWEVSGLVLRKLNNSTKIGDIDGDIFIVIIDKAKFPWGLREYDKNIPPVDVLINTFGSQFSDRKVDKRNIVINEVQAIKIKVTTSTVADWIYENVIFEKNNKLIQIENGARYVPEFDQILSTFKFTN